MEAVSSYISQAYDYLGRIVDIVMKQWYIAVLVGVGIIVISKYLENIVNVALTIAIAIFLVLPITLQAFQEGNTVLGVVGIFIMALLYFIVKFITKVALFAVGAVAGYLFTTTLLGFIEVPLPENVPTEVQTSFGALNWIALAAGIVVGFLTAKFTRQLLILIGIFAGSYLSAMGMLVAYTGDPLSWKKAFPNPYGLLEVSQNALIVFLVTLGVLMVFGIYYNFLRRKKRAA